MRGRVFVQLAFMGWVRQALPPAFTHNSSPVIPDVMRGPAAPRLRRGRGGVNGLGESSSCANARQLDPGSRARRWEIGGRSVSWAE